MSGGSEHPKFKAWTHTMAEALRARAHFQQCVQAVLLAREQQGAAEAAAARAHGRGRGRAAFQAWRSAKEAADQARAHSQQCEQAVLLAQRQLQLTLMASLRAFRLASCLPGVSRPPVPSWRYTHAARLQSWGVAAESALAWASWVQDGGDPPADIIMHKSVAGISVTVDESGTQSGLGAALAPADSVRLEHGECRRAASSSAPGGSADG